MEWHVEWHNVAHQLVPPVIGLLPSAALVPPAGSFPAGHFLQRPLLPALPWGQSSPASQTTNET